MGYQALVDEFCCQLRRRQFQGSLAIAKRTAEFLRTLVSQHKLPEAAPLLVDVREVGVQLQLAVPKEMVIGNVTRRVLHMVREEIALDEGEASNQSGSEEPSSLEGATQSGAGSSYPAFSSLRNLLDPVHFRDGIVPEASMTPGLYPLEKTGKKKKKEKAWKRKDMVIESINEYLGELDGIPNQIASQSLDHIHAHEVVLTIGYSETALLFLETASKKRLDLRVVVSEGGPKCTGHKMAKNLSEMGIQTTVITDAAIFAMMARVDQVFIGCRTLLANGGVIAESGSHLVALAAKQHAVSFVVLVGLHKLTPFYPCDPSTTLNDFRASSEVADFQILAEGQMGALEGDNNDDQDGVQKVDVINPAFDYVPGDLVSLFITDQGGVTPSYVYRLLDECYSREDCVLNDELEDLLSN